MYNVDKSQVDKLNARKPQDFRLFNTPHEFLIDQKKKKKKKKDFYRTFPILFDSI